MPPVEAPPRRASLFDRLETTAAAGRGLVFPRSVGDVTMSWPAAIAEATRRAGRLQQLGVEPGDRVAVCAETSADTVLGLLATWLAGGVAVNIAGTPAAPATERLLAAADPRIVLVDGPDADGSHLVDLASLGRGSARYEQVVRSDDDLAFLQFTSGSTADPKGVEIRWSNVIANVEGMRDRLLIDADDTMVSWLPLYHDMGLVGTLLIPMLIGCGLVLGTPRQFISSPRTWMSWISQHRGSISAAPSFAYGLTARAISRSGDWDLSSWRVAINGGEPVDCDAANRFSEAGAAFGLPSTTLMPAYGMAEATLGIAFPQLELPMTTDDVDRDSLEAGRPAPGRAEGSVRLAVLGSPVGDTRFRVLDRERGVELGPRSVGEVNVAGSAVFHGYWRDDAATSAARRDGWFATGDLGYTNETGELVLCGRSKDLIIIGGRNIHPQDVEAAAGAVHGVRNGSVIAFGVPGRRGREGVVVVAEARTTEPVSTRREVARAVQHAIGVDCDEVVLVRPGSLPKTTSGKLQRARCRTAFLVGESDGVIDRG